MIIRLDSCPHINDIQYLGRCRLETGGNVRRIFFCFQFGGRFWQVKMYVGYYSKFKIFPS